MGSGFQSRTGRPIRDTSGDDNLGNHADTEPDDDDRHNGDDWNRIKGSDPRIHHLVEPFVDAHEEAQDNPEDAGRAKTIGKFDQRCREVFGEFPV